MAPRIAQEVIDDIRDACDIVELIGDYLTLKKAGKNHKGICPFHNERTPSFNVSQDKQLYYCFGCGAGGNVINFVMEIENLGFPEALEFLGKRFGITVPDLSASKSSEPDGTKELLAVNAKAAEFFSRCLWEAPLGAPAREYLQKRQIDPLIAQEFQLGFAPNGGHYLLTYLRKAGLKLEPAIELGLAAMGRNSSPYERFRNRLMFPIKNRRGEVMGFGGRVLGEGGPKYLNSPESVLFNKSKVLYGLDLARKSIKRNDEVIMVEGYMDVIALHQGGIAQTVASLGTALTNEQVDVLHRETQKIFIAYDADMAGQGATIRGLELLRNNGMEVRLIELPEGEDPDSFIRNRGDFHKLKEESLPLIDYHLKLALGKGPWNASSRVQALRRVIPVLASIENTVEREVYLEEVSRQLGVSTTALGTELGKYQGKAGKTSRYRHTIEQSSYNSIDAMQGQHLIEMQLVRLMLDNPQLVQSIAEKVTLEDFTNKDMRMIVEKIFQRMHAGYHTKIQDIAQDAQVQASGVLAHLIREDAPVGSRDLADKCIDRMKEYRLSAALQSMEADLAKDNDSLGFLHSLLIRYKDLKDSIGKY